MLNIVCSACVNIVIIFKSICSCSRSLTTSGLFVGVIKYGGINAPENNGANNQTNN